MRATQTVEVYDRRHGTTRAVQATIEAPSLKGLDIKALAQKAYDNRALQWSDGTVTVSVKIFGRR